MFFSHMKIFCVRAYFPRYLMTAAKEVAMTEAILCLGKQMTTYVSFTCEKELHDCNLYVSKEHFNNLQNTFPRNLLLIYREGVHF